MIGLSAYKSEVSKEHLRLTANGGDGYTGDAGRGGTGTI